MRHTQSSDTRQGCRQKATIPLLPISVFQFFTVCVCDDKIWRDDRCVSCPEKLETSRACDVSETESISCPVLSVRS
jgi:hypothetical protein